MNDIDYLEIILQGYYDENHREHLSSYFTREQEKAKSKFYSKEEFFGGCLKQINRLEDTLEEEVYKRQSMLYKMLDSAENGDLKYSDPENKKPIETRHQETIENCNKELATINTNNFSINLLRLTNGKYRGHLYAVDVLNIKEAVNNLSDNSKIIDEKLWLANFGMEKHYSDEEYDIIEKQNKKNGFLLADANQGRGKVKIYNTKLFFTLTTKGIEVQIYDRDRNSRRKTIDGWKYFESFQKGYIKGGLYFNKTYSVNAETLFGANAKNYIDQIHQKYFHEKINGFNTGWEFVKKSTPQTLTHKIAENYGYYSGILNEVDILTNSYPIPFKNFHNCENTDNTEPIGEIQNTITKERLIKEENKLIPKISIEEVFNYFNILTTSCNNTGHFYLTNEQLLIFVKSTFIDRNPKKQNFNCTLNSKKDIRSLFYRFYKKCTILENKQTNLKTKYFDIMNDAFIGFTQADFKSWNKTNNNIEA